MTVRVLAIADEIAEALFGEALGRLKPDLIVSAGDLPFEYLENLVSRTNRPHLFVPGNHDPDAGRWRSSSKCVCHAGRWTSS